ncbi:MAG: adenylate/guanylate cyclase domain-containing protein [Alphaproteobacteria bacterium]
MTEERLQRRLAAILAADVVGYTRLMAGDEAGTLARLKALRAEVFDPETARFGGRIFKTTGDGALVEFASAVDAVQCAVEIQRALAERNTAVAEDQRTVLRIGVSLGDVIVDEDDLFGNGVSVASRMEGLAEPGEICISENVHEHVSGSLDVEFIDIGEQSVKNIDRPIRCFRVRLGPVASMETKALPAAEKPSIAVLPFNNMSGDPEQEYFSDGITEDIITALSRIRQLFVMARNTSFTFKGCSVDVQAVARELGVRYVLEGSVRKAGNRVRITAQLIDGASGNHLWAERYDRELKDIFAVQDEITQVVAGALEPAISKAEFERVRRTPPGNLDAWSQYQIGMHHFHKITTDGDEDARTCFRAAIALDPSFSAPHASLARTYSRGAMTELPDDMEKHFQIAVASAKEAIALDREDAYAHTALGLALQVTDADAAIRALEEALSINPNLAVAHFGIGMAFVAGRQPERAVSHLETAMRLSPRDPLSHLFNGMMGTAYFALGDYQAALEWSSKGALIVRGRGRIGAMRIAALAHLGREAEMIKERDELLEIIPHLAISRAVAANPGLGSAYEEGLRQAGLPE